MRNKIKTTADKINKISAKDIIDQSGIYEIMGIDIKKCNMPIIGVDGFSRQTITSDPNSVGHFIFTRLQPLLEDLVKANIIEQKAPFFDSEIHSIKETLASELSVMATQAHQISHDKDAISGLTEKMGETPIVQLLDVTRPIIDEVNKTISNKVRAELLKPNQVGNTL